MFCVEILNELKRNRNANFLFFLYAMCVYVRLCALVGLCVCVCVRVRVCEILPFFKFEHDKRLCVLGIKIEFSD